MDQVATALVFLAVLCGLCYGQTNRDALRQALNQDPLFSHQRDRAVPVSQNINVRLPVNDPIVVEQSSPVDIPPAVPALSQVQAGPTVLENRNVVPAQLRAVQPQGQAQINTVAVQSNMGGPLWAGKPVRETDLIIGQVAPSRIAQTQPPLPPSDQPLPTADPFVNDRMLNNVRPAASAASLDQQMANTKTECSFSIPSFLLPDPVPSQLGTDNRCPSFLLPGPNINPELVTLMVEHWANLPHTGNPRLGSVRSQITQVEFEQKCLIPAIQAYVLGGPVCRTRELKVYLEWLLFLRQKLFSI